MAETESFMKSVTLLFWTSFVALCTGCASHNYQASLARSGAPPSDKAFLYGRFKVQRGFMLATQLSLQLTNTQSGQNLGLRLKSGDDVYAVAVQPGEYQMSHIVLAKAGPNLEFVGDYSRIALTFSAEQQGMARPFKVEAGKAYYLGDFFGVTTRTSFSPVGLGGFSVGFGGDVTEIRFNFDETTGELRKLYPQFLGIETLPAWKRE